MEHTKELLSVPPASLVPSRFTARRHLTGQVDELAAQIEAQGLLHNLVITERVVRQGKPRKLKFAVAAGARRRRAMLLLHKRGRLPNEHEVLCELVPPERALEVILAEISGCEATHSADEFDTSKAQIIEAIEEASPDLADAEVEVEATKKDALVTAMAPWLAGTGWLPKPLRRSPG